jgi:hypothetical protein
VERPCGRCLHGPVHARRLTRNHLLARATKIGQLSRTMKSLLVIFSALCSASLLAQGTLEFANDTATRIRNVVGAGFPPALSTAWSAGIYWGSIGTAESALNLLPAGSNGVTQTWPQAGVFNGSMATFPVPGGTQIALQIRIWRSSYPDYASAFTADPANVFGKGIVQQITLGGGNVAPQSLVAPTGAGDTPFQALPVPEPGTITLAALGGLLLLLARRNNVPR